MKTHAWFLGLLLALGGAVEAKGELVPVLRGSWPGHPLGYAGDMVVRGQYGYVAVGQGGVAIFDLSDPAAVRSVGHNYAADFWARKLAVVGDHILTSGTSVAGISSTRLVDVRAPAQPFLVSQSAAEPWEDSATSGTTVFAITRTQFTAFDLADATEIKVHAARMLLFSNLPDGVSCLALAKNMAYVGGWSGMEIIDLQDFTKPISLGRFFRGKDFRGMTTEGDRLYAYGDRQILVLDISHPSKPVLLATIPFSPIPNDLAVGQGKLYLVRWDQGLDVMDVTEPASARIVAHLPLKEILGIRLVGDVAYLHGNSLYAVDLTSSPPRVLSETLLNIYLSKVVPFGEYALAIDYYAGLRLFDIRQPDQPRAVALFPTATRIRDLAFTNNHALLAADTAGLQVWNFTEPTKPSKVGSFNTGQSTSHVTAQGNLAVVTDEENDLTLLNVTNPARPRPEDDVSQINGSGKATLAGSYGYFTHGGGFKGFEIYDLSRPSSPRALGRYSLNGTKHIAAGNGFAYVSWDNGTTSGVDVVDVRDPRQPTRAGRYSLHSQVDFATASDLVGDRLIVALKGLEVLDVRDPANPHRVAANRTHPIEDFARQGNYLYATSGTQGLLVYELVEMNLPTTLTWRDGGDLPPSLELRGLPGAPVQLQRSANLLDWENWQLAEPAFEDVSLPVPFEAPRRFYRAVRP